MRVAVEIDGKRHELGLPANLMAMAPGAPAAEPAPEADDATVTAPVPGTLTAWQVEDGAQVEAGQVIAVMEAMKMETRVEAHRAGRISRVAEAGEVLGFGVPLARIVG
ncbi:acetyl-CoA carboxylase biotin carboxyl carrier protein subunit [Paracoccus aerius]